MVIRAAWVSPGALEAGLTELCWVVMLRLTPPGAQEATQPPLLSPGGFDYDKHTLQVGNLAVPSCQLVPTRPAVFKGPHL